MSDFDSLPVPTLTFAFDVAVQLGRPEDHGATSAGIRRVVPILGGEVTGEIEAEILPGGADWQLIDADGTIRIDARYSARTSAGELVLLHAAGLRAGSPEVLERLGRGEDVDPAAYVFRTTVDIETSAPRLAHLQRSMFLASARRQAATVSYRTYRIG
ncbi:DUF3237 domain-containing protein [Microbacterium sp. H1-D42]|uniref:DUF3237 domain-containing protein n=1 Tax=Microbacterium sp. H1-D42 TaxID=2925844 RepID=UPI001F53BCE2|nr:DUF3237 domain-containing protein [Microbacterium sp. H1-D42]UNK71359.1 DUF3237 domain-containing protein [Microbacterium sp. H1-D42]